MNTLAENLNLIKSALKTGAINIFGLPMSGKDTVGKRLASDLDAEFLSSGDIIRKIEAAEGFDETGSGKLWPTDMFISRILPYFYAEELKEKPLILSTVGRWFGEEDHVMTALKDSGHEEKAVILLDLPEEEVKNRWQTAKELNDRGARTDDLSPEVFETRLEEFREKTVPVLTHYENLGLLIKVNANQPREAVYKEVVEHLAKALGE